MTVPSCGYTDNEIYDFWLFVASDDAGEDCWPWMGHYNRVTNRGMFQCPRLGFPRYAYRVAYEIVHGPIPAGLHACHSCDHPWCVNPRHIFIGTAKDNHEDAVAKGRKPQVLTFFHREPRTHCLRGHELVGTNLYISQKNGSRACRACVAMRSRAYYRRRLSRRSA